MGKKFQQTGLMKDSDILCAPTKKFLLRMMPVVQIHLGVNQRRLFFDRGVTWDHYWVSNDNDCTTKDYWMVSPLFVKTAAFEYMQIITRSS